MWESISPGSKYSFFLNLFLYFYSWLCWVFVSVRGLSPVAASGGHSSSWCAGLFTIAASPVAEHRLQTRRLSNCGSRAWLLRGIWDLPRPGLEPVSPALAGRFSTTVPPGKPDQSILNQHIREHRTHSLDWQLFQIQHQNQNLSHIFHSNLPTCNPQLWNLPPHWKTAPCISEY